MAESAPLETPLLFPPRPRNGATSLVLLPDEDRLPVVQWLGVLDEPLPGGRSPGAEFASDVAASNGARLGTPLLVEHARSNYRRPGLRGYRLAGSNDGPVAGRDWSTAFVMTAVSVDDARLVIDARDEAAGLALRTEVESVAGGALRIRHEVTNTGGEPFVVDGLDVSVPLSDRAVELLDFTGRHEHERSPQRHLLRDGQWLRENRRGRTGLESASMLIAGSPGFGFGHGDVLGVHVAFSGNSVLWAERDPSGFPTIGGGEFLLPGEVALAHGESYETPWVFVVAAVDGLDSVAAALHTWLRSVPAHPDEQPVVLNVWEAVYFDHDLDRLSALADRAARVGVERFVLDDGWFLGRRDDVAGLGDWWVDETVWPKGLHPLVEHVRSLGMQFGLWFEPEMVNPNSELFRRHPDWVLGSGGRLPHLSRNQLVVDLTNPHAWQFLLERMDSLLGEYAIDYVKWDHNRDLLEAGSPPFGTPVAHRQALAYYALLDELSRRHPQVAWESCAAGGGRIDLGVLERVQRVWTSDMTDARARQQIQRWTVQFVAPEYLGAHVSATRSHQTGRTMSLDFRAATALFGSFGIEWDLTDADEDELADLSDWVARYKRHRRLLHGGRTVRMDSSDPAVWLHGVVAADGRSALLAHVQLDESASNRGVLMRVPHLIEQARYDIRWAAPVDTGQMSQSPALDPAGPTLGRSLRGAVLAQHGVWLPRRRPETILLMHLEAR